MTYGDMMSLLLTFFVLIVSFSSMQEAKFKQAALSLQEAFGVMASARIGDRAQRRRWCRTTIPATAASEFLYEVRNLERAVLDDRQEQDVEVEIRDDGVLFRMNAPFLFASGAAELRPEATPLLDRLGRMLPQVPRRGPRRGPHRHRARELDAISLQLGTVGHPRRGGGTILSRSGPAAGAPGGHGLRGAPAGGGQRRPPGSGGQPAGGDPPEVARAGNAARATCPWAGPKPPPGCPTRTGANRRCPWCRRSSIR